MSSSHTVQSTKIKDYAIYIAVGILIVVVITSLAYYEAKGGHTSGLPIKWLGFAIMTALVFGNIIRYAGALRRVPRFWIFLGVFSITHVVFGILILSRITETGLVQFAAATVIEYLILRALITRLVTAKSDRAST